MNSDQRTASPVTGVVKGASRAFGILLIGGAVQPLVGTALPALGYVWLALVALGAFGVAGWMAAGMDGSALSGAAAAVLSYVLVLPLVLNAGSATVEQVAITSASALVVGLLTSLCRVRIAKGAGR